jgi:hypothetical protein
MNHMSKRILALALSLPVLLVIGTVLAIYLPQQMIKPGYNFLYAETQSNYGFNNFRIQFENQDGKGTKTILRVENGKLGFYESVKTDAPSYYSTETPRAYNSATDQMLVDKNVKFYIYDFEKNESRAVSLEEAMALALINSEKSPDDFSFGTSYGGDNGLFFEAFGPSRRSYDVYISKRSVSKKLPIETDGLVFLGWINK